MIAQFVGRNFQKPGRITWVGRFLCDPLLGQIEIKLSGAHLYFDAFHVQIASDAPSRDNNGTFLPQTTAFVFSAVLKLVEFFFG